MKSLLIALFSLALLQGADGNTAKVYVYRYKQFVGKALRPSIFCDEREAARVQNGRYVPLLLPAGKHSFRSTDKQSEIELELEAGRTYYIRLDIATGFWKGHGRLSLLAPEQGKPEVNKTRLIDQGMVIDRTYLDATEAKW
jgi:hypothetical protein